MNIFTVINCNLNSSYNSNCNSFPKNLKFLIGIPSVEIKSKYNIYYMIILYIFCDYLS